jgi:hypothetical protein
MAVNIALALQNVDFNKINITLVDGLSIDKLKIRYNWIFNASIEDALIGEDDYGLVWYSGNWICGDWYDGTWYSGNFESGTWKNGRFYSYKLNKYDVLNGNFNIIDKGNQYSIMGVGDGFVEWETGNFYGGIFGTKTIDWTLYTPYDPNNPDADNDITNNSGQTCVWRNGNFYDGIIYNAIWYDGNWYDGYMVNIQWINGKFYNGRFNGFIWYNGTFLGGDFINGVWKDGIFTTFNANIKSRFGVTENVVPVIKDTITSGVTSFQKPLLYTQFSDGATNWSNTGLIDVITNQIHESRTNYSASSTSYTISYFNSLSIYGFGFNIPVNSTISGVEVNISLYDAQADITNQIVISNVTLSKFPTNNVANQSNDLATNNILPTFPSGFPYPPLYYNHFFGGDGNLWGMDLTRDDINSNNFSVNFRLRHTVTNSNFAYFAGLVVKIYYTTNDLTYSYERCTWSGGTFNNGEFHSGLNVDSNNNITESGNHKISVWENGIFNNGKWYGGSFESGTWNNGEFLAGYFGTETTTTVWNDGKFTNGFWVNGTFNNGEFHNGLIKNINLKNGKIGD